MERKYWENRGKVREICQSENVGTVICTSLQATYHLESPDFATHEKVMKFTIFVKYPKNPENMEFFPIWGMVRAFCNNRVVEFTNEINCNGLRLRQQL